MKRMIVRWGWIVGISIMLLLAGCQDQAAPAIEGGEEMSMQVTSSTFKEGEKIPRIYTCDDQNVSPPLAWTGVPTDTVSLALVMDDPDAPSGNWVHWVLYNLPPELNSLEQGKSGGGTEGKNDFWQDWLWRSMPAAWLKPPLFYKNLCA